MGAGLCRNAQQPQSPTSNPTTATSSQAPRNNNRRFSSYDVVHKKVLDDIFKTHDKRGLRGLNNLGNTCFMNSALQCLSNTQPLSDYFLGYNYKSEINKSNPLGSKGELATVYGALVKELWGSEKPTPVTPKHLKSKMERFAPQFIGYDQHDIQELLTFLLDGLHEDLNRVTNKQYVEDVETTEEKGDFNATALKAWSGYLQRNKSIIVDLFQGQLKSTLRCRNKNSKGGKGCGNTCVKFESFMYLSLPLNANCNSLQECIQEFCKSETLDGDNMWYCSACKEHVRARKKLEIWKLPPVLMIHLKRFEFGTGGRRRKIDRFIKTPVEDFDLSELVASEQREPPVYDLYAVSNHHGGLGGGHYTAYSKNRSDEKWHDFNDESVREIDVRRVEENGSAYVLFFNRVVEVEEGGEEEGEHVKKVGRVRRQSVSMPHLWPHSLSGKPPINVVVD